MIMRLRKLKQKDISLMLEWMHDPVVVKNLKADFASKTSMDCKQFIEFSWTDEYNLNLAITDESDQYKGTVSLKNIDKVKGTAEFAIVIRVREMGRGIAREAMTEVMRIGFEVMGLSKIYWYVSRDNTRAIRFYEKLGYQKILNNEKILSEKIQKDFFVWYQTERK